MSRYPVVPLRDAVQVEREIVDPVAVPSGTLYVGLEHIETGGRFRNVAPIQPGELASSKFAFTPRHILYGKLRPYLAKIARPHFSGICSTDILPLVTTSRADASYVRWLLLSPSMVARANALASGANLPRISPAALGSLEIPLPPLEEQRRIASILDRADALRARRRAALAQLDTLAQAVFLEMFGDLAINPRNWPVKPLGRLIASGPQNGLYKPAGAYGQGTRILRIDAFYDGRLTNIESLKRLEVNEDERQTYGLKAGDIVINRVNSRQFLGKSAIVPVLTEPVVFESNMMRFAPDPTVVTSEFLVQYLQSSAVKAHILRCAKDAINQSSINQQDVKGIPVMLPPLQLQRLFQSRAAQVANALAHGRRSLDELNTFFASLQHRAFRGEL